MIDAARFVRSLGRRHPLAPIVLGVLLYSMGPVFVQASDVSGPVFSFWRLWIGVVALGVASAVHASKTGGWPAARAWRWSLIAGVAFGLHQLTMFSAIKASTVADVTLINALAPVVTGLLAVPLFDERPGLSFWGWSLIAMAGTAVVVFGATADPQAGVMGVTLAFANVVAFAVFFVISKRSRQDLAVLPFLFGVIAVAAVFVSGYVAVAGEAVGSISQLDLVYTGVVAFGPGLVGHFVTTWPLRWVPANVPPVMRLGVPALAATWAWSFLGEPITAWHLLGGAIIVAGVAGAILSRAGRRLVAAEAAGRGG